MVPPLQLVYFDQNPFDHLMDAGFPSGEIADAMELRGYQMFLSEDNMQEWAACWKSGTPEKAERGRRLTSYARDLRPRQFLAPTQELLAREAESKLQKRQISPFLAGIDRDNAEQLISNLSIHGVGVLEQEKMLKKWHEKEKAVREFEQVRTSGFTGGLNRNVKNFDQFLSANRQAVRALAETELKIALSDRCHTPRDLQKIVRFGAKRVEKCPVLCAVSRAQLYITYRLLTGRRMPHDRWDDLRHCVSAVFADIFVTGDQELRETFTDIRLGPRYFPFAISCARSGWRNQRRRTSAMEARYRAMKLS